MAAAPPSLEDDLRALAMRASQLPSLLLHSIPPGTSLLASQSHTSNFISASIAFINQSLHLINDLSSSINQLLINQSTSQAAATESGTSIHQGGGAAGPVIDEEMREEAVRNAREATDRFEQMEERGKDSDQKRNEGNKSPKDRKPSVASDGVPRGIASSSGRVRSRRSDSNKGITVHFPGENVPDHFDHYTWRKYGEKKIYGKEKRRGYYRCTLRREKGCEAMRRVQACEAPLQGYYITYINDHTCGSGSIRENPVIAALLGRGTCPDHRNVSSINFDCITPNVHDSMPLLADPDPHGPIYGSNTVSPPYHRTLADPHCSIDGACTSSPYHRNLLHINTTVTPTLPTPTNANTTAAAISDHINELTLCGGELASLLHPFINPAPDYIKPAVALDYINPTPSCHRDLLGSPRLMQQPACSQDQLESTNSSTPSSSKHSTDDQEVAFPIIRQLYSTSGRQISLKLHGSSDNQDKLSTAFMSSEAHSFDPSDLDDIIHFDSWPYS